MIISGMSFSDKQEEMTREEWLQKLETNHIHRSDMNHLIMNYLVTEGFKEAAEKFEVEAGLQASVDLDTLDDRIQIRDHIQSGRINEATTLVNKLMPELLDNERYLYFLLQQQQLIELIRCGETERALSFAQAHLAECGEENHDVLGDIERTLALLAFDEPEKSPFGDLLHPSHRQKVASEVNAAILKLENQKETTPQLTKLLKLILWSQEQLDRRKVSYPKMTDLATANIEEAQK